METKSQKVESRVLSVDALNNAPAHRTLVVTPTYNERDNVAAFIEAVASAGCDLLIVDDASPDGTAETARAKAATTNVRVFLMRRRGKLGLGTAYSDAFAWVLASKPEYPVVVQMDTDFSHDPAMAPKLAEAAMSSGVAIGSRYVPGGSTPDWPLRRKILSRGANLYVALVIGLRLGRFPIHDATSGFVSWRRDALEKVFAEPVMAKGYAFLTETKYRATRMGYRPTELAITFPDRTRGVSKISHAVILEAITLPWRLRSQ